MNITRYGRPMAAIAVAASAALVFTGCAANEGGGDSASDLTGTLVGAGASSQGAAQEAWIAAFQTANPGVTITYDPTGSGAGRETFAAGGSNYAGSDSYLKDDELAVQMAPCAAGTQPFEIPAYISPIAVIYNIDGVDELNLDAATIAGIFKGDITMWDDAAIVAQNPNAKLPNLAITAVHRSDDSGTTKNFSDYLFQNAADVWTIEKPADPFPFSSGEGAQGTSGVVAAVTNGTGTIGYADASKAGDLGIVKIKVGNEYVAYTPEGAAALVAGGKAVDGRDATDMAIKLDRTTTNPKEYPIALVSYLIGCNEYAEAGVADLVKPYFTYILSEQGQLDAQANAGSAPLSRAVADQAQAIIDAIK